MAKVSRCGDLDVQGHYLVWLEEIMRLRLKAQEQADYYRNMPRGGQFEIMGPYWDSQARLHERVVEVLVPLEEWLCVEGSKSPGPVCGKVCNQLMGY